MRPPEVCALPAGLAATPLPPLHLAEQRFRVPPAVDPVAEIDAQWDGVWREVSLKPGAAVAVAVGSRGIGGLPGVVSAVVAHLRQAGCVPFVVSAMGSHGNASAAGQEAVLADLGITQATVGAPVRASVDVVDLGEADGVPLYTDRCAYEADGVVLINRVKQHTDFVGRFESGLMKMLVIGLGNDAGATACHRHAVSRGLADVLTIASRALLEQTKVVLGVALVENQQHRTTMVRLLPPDQWEQGEPELLDYARSLLPRLPIEDIDVLLVDEMGKNISGAGMDPNVTGRSVGCWVTQRTSPRISRIVVRRLTEASEGNACGLGSVDVAPLRLVESIDLSSTATNALVSCAPEDCKIPLTLATDREALIAAMATLRPYSIDDLRLVHIRNTLDLERIELSAGCRSYLSKDADVAVSPNAVPLAFDPDGGLLSRLL